MAGVEVVHQRAHRRLLQLHPDTVTWQKTLVTITHLVWSPQPSPKYTISPEDSLSWEQKRVEKYELLAAKTICLVKFVCVARNKTRHKKILLCAL